MKFWAQKRTSEEVEIKNKKSWNEKFRDSEVFRASLKDVEKKKEKEREEGK